MCYNKTVAVVNLTKDGEVRYTQDQKAILKFSAANNRGYGDNQRTIFYECSLWGERAEKLVDSFKKGTKLLIEGVSEAGAYVNKDGKAVAVNNFTVDSIEFLSAKVEGKPQQSAPVATGATPTGFLPVQGEQGILPIMNIN